eukprot:1964864-Rhodomonas_salina.2
MSEGQGKGDLADGGVVLDANLMLEFTGEEALDKISNLILRGLGLTNVAALNGACNVVSVSLSHNELCDIQLGANALPFLTELNVNNNKLSQLDWTACCPKLQHLYASCNGFSDLAPLAKCPELSKACLHGNAVEDLEGSLEALSTLTKLTELELDGNPCEAASGYKHLIIAHLPELTRLDCATVMSNDRENARNFAAYQQKNGGSLSSNKENEEGGAFFTHSDIAMPEQYSSAKISRRRPTTSHQNTKQYRDSTVKPSSARLARSLASTSMEVLDNLGSTHASRPDSEENGRLFRDDFLNQNPILVEYMAQAALEDETSQSEGAEAHAYEDEEDSSDGAASSAREPGASSTDGGEVQLLDMDRHKHRPRSSTASSSASTRPQTGETAQVRTTERRSSRRGFASELRQ